MITFVIGAMGSGKSTYIKEKATFSDVILDWDDIRETLNDVNAQITSDVMVNAMRECIKKDINCYVSAVVPTEAEYESVRNEDVKWVYIDVSKSEAVSNRIKRNRHNEADMPRRDIEDNYENEVYRIEQFIEANNIEVQRVRTAITEERW